MDNQDSIVEKLVALTKELQAYQAAYPGSSELGELVQFWPDGLKTEPLLRELQRCPDLASFDNTRQIVGRNAASVDFERLLRWMVMRSTKVGGLQTVHEVDAYVSSESFEAYHVMLLTDTLVDHESEIGDGIRIASIRTILSEALQQAYSKSFHTTLPLPQVHTALVSSFLHPRRHLGESESSEILKTLDLGTPPLETARLALTLSRSSGLGIQAIAGGIVTPDFVPNLVGQSWRLFGFRPRLMPQTITASDCKTAAQTYSKLVQLDPDEGLRLYIPIFKLNEYASTTNMTEQAISLRTAFEAMFLDGREDNTGELSRTVALRAALFLEEDPAKRANLRSLVKDVYGLGSSAIHSGKFKPKQMKNARKKLKDGAEVVRRAIEHKIDVGKVDWNAVENSGGLLIQCNEG